VRFFVGGYAAAGDGHAEGIGVLHAGDPDGALAGGTLSRRPDAVRVGGSPSWLAWHPLLDVLYAALETSGAVQAFRRTGPETFVALGDPVAVGELVCHVAVEPGGRWLVASCWGDGRVVRVSLDAEGRVGRISVAAAAVDQADPPGAASEDFGPEHLRPKESGLDLTALLAAARGESVDDTAAAPLDGAARPSRAHQARFLPGGMLVTTDVGLDLVRVWHPASAGLREAQRVALPAGTGPRHTVWHPSGHLYVVTELSHEVFVLAPPTGSDRDWRLVGGSPVSPATIAGSDFAAEIALSRDAEFVYVGVRGSNTVATLRVRGTGAELMPVALTESGVDWPRHHVIARDTLLMAGQRSDAVASLALDLRTGVPGRVRHRVEAASPSMLLPDRS
jgi:6-phosphogluconolactonase (cycloisomerase 2 family)